MKIIGALLILCASICSCVFYEKNEKSKISSAIKACDFIKYIKTQIEYFSTPINKIIASYEDKSPLIEDLSTKSFSVAKRLLDRGDFKLVFDFFSSLGKGLKDEELSLCSYTIEELQKCIEKKEKDYPDKIKVFRAMALFFGFCVIILLI